MPIHYLPEPGLVQRVCILLNILLPLKVSEDLGKVTYTLTLPYGGGYCHSMSLRTLARQVGQESAVPNEDVITIGKPRTFNTIW